MSDDSIFGHWRNSYLSRQRDREREASKAATRAVIKEATEEIRALEEGARAALADEDYEKAERLSYEAYVEQMAIAQFETRSFFRNY